MVVVIVVITEVIAAPPWMGEENRIWLLLCGIGFTKVIL
jgi:hypothetical protein